MAEIKIALAGNPNCGKTTLFNALTGSNQYVGNWPGVTVEKKEGNLLNHKGVVIQDLPGIYSLSPYTLEEVVSRNYLIEEKPDAILNIIDGTNIERNLYLTTQLLEVGVPTLVAINMMDLVKKSGDRIDVQKLSEGLGCPVMEMSALKGVSTMAAAEETIKLTQQAHPNERPHVFTGSVEHAIAHIEESIETLVAKENLRWYAIKVFERDEKVLEKLHLSEDVRAHIEQHIVDCEKEMDDTSESIITNQRYEYIKKLVDQAVVKKHDKNSLTLSDRIDQVMTNRFLAIFIFLGIMALVYYVAVATVGQWATDWTNDTLVAEWIQQPLQAFLENVGTSPWLVSLVVDGIIGGLGAPIGFAPQMAIVFLFLSILEDCGYMARVAFIMDRLFRRFGLSGKSFIPFMISSGCGVPGIMATRTIENEKDRRMTMITTTNMPCGAKLPVIALIAGYILGNNWRVAFAMYVLGVAVIICSCIILKKTKYFSGDPAPFVMELPPYHIPSLKGVLLHVWERVWAFLKKAGTILFVCCVVMWFLASFGIQDGVFGLVDKEQSFLAVIGNWFAFIFAPLGFNTWQAVASSISGFVAKEGIVTTMGVLAGLGEVEEYEANMHQAFSAFFPTNMVAVSFLIFNLFDSPCLAAISTLSKEMGSRRYFWFAILFQNLTAYMLALLFYQIGGYFTGEVAFGPWTIVAFAIAIWILYLLFRPDPYKKKGKVQAA